MLDFLRKRKRSWIITFLLGLIIIVFIAFYGGSNYQDARSPDIAAVNGETISQREFAIHYAKSLERYRELLKGSLTPELLKNLNLKGSLLEELIQKRLLLQEARALGLTATDDELVNHLARLPEFQVAGRFNKERYLQLLRANRMNPVEFEDEQRDQLTIQRLYGVILDSVQVSEADVRNRYRYDQEKINLYFIRLPVVEAAATVKLTEEEIKKFYDRNKESMKEPLRLQVEYVTYPFDRYASNAQITEKEIADYYQANRDAKFRKPRETKLSYILIRAGQDADAKQKQDARARAGRIVAEARGGKDFGELAKRSSEDPSAAKGGDLGWLVQGQLPPALAGAVSSLAKGQVSDPVEGPAGFQIVKVEDIREESAPAQKEVIPQIIATLKTEKGKREAGKIADRDREKALTGVDFAKLAGESGATVNVTRWFANGEVLPEIGPNQDFYKIAFSLGVKDVSPVVEGNNAYHLLRIKQRKEPTVPPLETVKAKIEKGLTESKAYESTLQKGNSLLERLKKEKNLARLAEQNGLKLDETGWFVRSAPQLPKIGELPDGGAVKTLSAQKPVAGQLITRHDAAYLFAFKDSQDADTKQFEQQKDTLMKQAQAEARQQVLMKFMEGLKTKANIAIRSELLEEG